MARPPKPKYEYIKRNDLYRKRVKGRDGKYVALYARTPDELTERVIEFEEDVRLHPIKLGNPLVSEYVDTWLELSKGHLSFGTYTDYQSIIKQHIKPPMEGYYMQDVKPDDIKRIMLGVAKMSKSVHDKTYMIAKQVFTSAFDNGIIYSNPCPRMHAGGNEPKEREALTSKQVETLLEAVKGTRAYVFCMIGLYAGLRREEILGLQWDCVRLVDTPCITVRRACRFVHNRPEVTDKLKTKASKRTVPIPPQLVKCLADAKKVSKSKYVISSDTNEALSGTQFKRLWNYIDVRTAGSRVYYRYVDGKKEAHFVEAVLGEKAKHNGSVVYTIDFNVTPHILRHTYITNLLLAGVDVKTVQYLAGHERAKLTLDIYAHLTYNRPEDIINKVVQAFPLASEA